MISEKSIILITGASGFIGTNLVDFYENKKCKIVNFDKKAPTKRQQEKYWVQGDIMNLSELEQAFTKYNPTIVVHLAARTDTLSDKLDDYKENFIGTENIIKTIDKTNSVKHALFASTQYVYKSKEVPFGVDDDNYAPHTVYGISKMNSEEIIRHSNMRCMWTIFRPCNVWGPWHMRYPDELWKVIAKGYYIHPSHKPVIRTYAYVKNLVYQLDKIINAEQNLIDKKTFYLGDMPIDSYIWLNEFSIQLRNKKILRIHKIFFAYIAVIGDVLRQLGIKFPLYSQRYHNMVEDFYAPSNITMQLFGTRNNDISQNVAETIEWLKSEGAEFFQYWNGDK
ncbi:NAD-dependent epimerase/dehydratase family protein [uncultured Bacteroides sp.]|uniref:NAD-dependent epimerase/dehydratase family protein n=1 Tax=uncultured Bacteroides sp. TaxID=162156 RepID=UPI002AA6553B|nr:NAD-dependent epimerase/dehydratase family protein [uncultured Bacteroides sp.]